MAEMIMTEQGDDLVPLTPIICKEKLGDKAVNVDISAITAALYQPAISINAVVKDENGKEQIILEPNSPQEI
jgi:hypothetical protein